ncbi:MAG: hypothetical protein CM1200mP26_18580 [Acidimicrobiales bacterium]|nr:MAG: hypothetical protein CM1200mP26_18580 [Acidimicrobiales bacterium]
MSELSNHSLHASQCLPPRSPEPPDPPEPWSCPSFQKSPMTETYAISVTGACGLACHSRRIGSGHGRGKALLVLYRVVGLRRGRVPTLRISRPQAVRSWWLQRLSGTRRRVLRLVPPGTRRGLTTFYPPTRAWTLTPPLKKQTAMNSAGTRRRLGSTLQTACADPTRAGTPESWTTGRRLYGWHMAKAERRARRGAGPWAPTAPGT